MPLVTINPVVWSTIRRYSPADFKHPEKLDDAVVRGLDHLANGLPRRPIPIDDYRVSSDKDDSQHLYGRAIDFVVPDVDSVAVLTAIRNARAFSGFGLYTNEKNVQSYHVDTRPDRTVENPATWGAWKDRTQNVTVWQYDGLSQVLNMVKKNTGSILPVVLILGALWLLLRER